MANLPDAARPGHHPAAQASDADHVVVPEDADVHIGGTGIIGGFDHHDEGPGTPGAPRITITGFVFCGSVEVQRAKSGRAYAPLTG